MSDTFVLLPGYHARPGDWSSGTGVTYPFGRSVNFEYQEVHRDWTGATQAPLTAGSVITAYQ